MMDDLLSLDFNFLDDDLLSFAMDDDFNPIESREIESILNEIEHSTNEKIFNVQNSFITPTIMFNSNNKNNILNNTKVSSKKSKNKIGTSLLAKPPKKLKKDKNSLLKNNSSSLLINKKMNSEICQATFTAYFYQDHNYCFNSTKLQRSHFNEALNQENTFSTIVDLNNNDEELKFNNLTIAAKEIVIDNSEDEISKKKSLTNLSFNLISPNNLFNNSSCEIVHDVDEYFNISFSNSEGTDSTHQSETEDENKFDFENEINFPENVDCKNKKEEKINKQDIRDQINENKTNLINEASKDELVEKLTTELMNNEIMNNQIDNEAIETKEIKNILIDDINNYNINEINDTDNELISLEDEEDDILIEADILIDEMFGDFAEYDLISKKSKISKSSANKKINNRIVSNKNQLPKTVLNTNRRTRTISNSYSVRSSSSCSCCSDDMSEEEQPKHNESTTKHTHVRSNNTKINRRSTSKLIKSDNTFIRKKNNNNGRFLIHKNTSF